MKISESLQIISKTHPGMVRTHNEDSVDVDESIGLVVLADGMGGYNAGEVASGIAVSVTVTEIVQSLLYAKPSDFNKTGHEELAVTLLRDKIHKANVSIFHASQTQSQYAGMGTTIVAALFYDNRVAVAHVGDSRLYRLRNEELVLLTRDHSLLQEQIDSGMISAEEARYSKNKNLVTRAVGVDAIVNTEIRIFDVAIGDIYLLCSDGLNDMVEDEDIEAVLHAMQGNLPLAADQLTQMANDNGGRDNVSVILVKVLSDFEESKGLPSKLFKWFKKQPRA